MEVLEKIRNLPELRKKVILWIIVVMVGGILGYIWLDDLQEKIKNFEIEKFQEELKLPELEINNEQ